MPQHTHAQLQVEGLFLTHRQGVVTEA
jgi:hypothetical protein